MEDMRAALAAKGYDIVEPTGDGSDSDSDQGLPGRIPSLDPNVAREKGKRAFEKGKYDQAIKYWQGGLKSILSTLCSGPEAMGNESLSELDLTLNLNIAMAYMKKGEYDLADKSVDKSLARREALPPNLITKALYRKASAQRAMNRLEEALETLKDLLQVEEGHPAGRQMQQEVEREWSKQVRAQKANMKKMFSKLGAEDKAHEENQRKARAKIRENCGVVWKPDIDVDSGAFEAGETPGCDGRDWGLALNRTLLWSIEQLAIEGSPCMQQETTHVSIWMVGVSSSCELRWLQPASLMSRLPGVQSLEIVLIGFLGELSPDNKREPDPKIERLNQEWVHTEFEGGRRLALRNFHGTLQDAVEKGFGQRGDSTVASAGAADDAPAITDAAAGGSTEASPPVVPAADGSTEASAPDVPAADKTANSPPIVSPPNVCFIAHPQLHRYFTDFYPAVSWLIKNEVPSVVVGASEPDPSWKQDEMLLGALGATLVVGKRLSPYPMCLHDNASVRKCNHIIGFKGGKAIARERLTKVKIELLSHDYSVR